MSERKQAAEKDIHLRIGSISDASAIAAVGREAFATAFTNEANQEEVTAYLQSHYSLAYIETQINDPSCTILVAETEGQIVGFEQLYVRRPKGHDSGKWLMIDRLYLLPSHIGSGLGRRLMEEGIALAKSKGMDWIWLMVLRPNKKAAQFYLDFGMQVFGESPGKFEADAEMDDWMRLRV